MPVELRSEQERIAKNEHRRLTYHERKKDGVSYRKEIQMWNKRNNRYYMRKDRPEQAEEVKNRETERKRKMRSQLSHETMVAERIKDADRKYVERIVSADVDPQHSAYMKKRHAKQKRERRAAEPENIQETKKLNNRMRMRARRQGKMKYDSVSLNKNKTQNLNSENNDSAPKRRYRRSPETRKIHAAQQRKRMASLSPNSAAKAKEAKAKRERERRAAKSEAQRKKDRHTNAARMREKQVKPKLDQAVPAVRQNFTIYWSFDHRSPKFKWNYYTVINGNEYIQYKLHALLIKDDKQ